MRVIALLEVRRPFAEVTMTRITREIGGSTPQTFPAIALGPER